jgi:LysM repeat protein
MIKLRNLIVCFFVLIAQSSLAQSGIAIQGTSPNLHLNHTVASKDTWFGIGRMYNISPKEIATYNGTTIDKPLSIGKEIKIPLTTANFSQNGTKAPEEVFVPLYHTVQPKEWMYRISVNHNKVPIENIEKWNNISRDNATAGTRLIVGYLKVKQGQSALSGGAVNNVSTPSVVAKDSPAPKKEDITKKPELVAAKDSPAPKKEDTGKKTEPAAIKKEEVVRNDESVKKVDPPLVKEVAKKEEVAESKNTAFVNFKGGYFKTQFGAGAKSASGVSGIFKSSSGWNDGKYYALMNNVPVGTIVRVNFPSTNKNIYAKVLGQLPDMRESEGLTIRISDAAATELGAANGKFTVDVKY